VKLKETEQAAVVALRDKDVAKQKSVATPAPQDDQQVMEISKLKQQISELKVQLEKNSVDKGGGADQGGGANDALRDKLISTTVSELIVHDQLSW